MPGARGLLLAGIAVVLVEAVTGVVSVLVLGPVEIALYLLACAVATAAMTAVAVRLITLGRGEDGGEQGGGGDDDEPPPWWPSFEGDFRRYVEESSTREPSRARLAGPRRP